jgi:uncharacterized protein YrrD
MLRTLDSLRGYKIQATDGEIGHVEDFLFDDATWKIRYFVVDTGPWLFGREVLISPEAVGEPSWDAEVLPVSLTKEEVENSPDVDLDLPVSRQNEEALFAYYGWQNYWMTLPIGTRAGVPATPPPAPVTPDEALRANTEAGDPHLRSVDEVVGYDVEARDGDVGSVDDFIVDDETWALRYMVITTGNWLAGREVLVSPRWVEDIDWETSDVEVALSQRDIKESPAYEAAGPLPRDYEERLHEHYGMKGYWM